MYKDKGAYIAEEIAAFVMRDMNVLGKSVRIVDSPTDKTDNEYVVAMKTSDILLMPWGMADYHFAVLLSDGTWADKQGQSASRWNKIDGTAATWDIDEWNKNYYNSESIYFAVEK